MALDAQFCIAEADCAVIGDSLRAKEGRDGEGALEGGLDDSESKELAV